ncbi:MAG: ABC transporter ATP-binding protein [Nitrososphaerota archaeon]|nr:ABC transporter ATP-binding protein [Nitrososphaerota archaeon]
MVKLLIEGVECYYGSIKALDGVSFSVNEREFVGVIGPNGSGKTTLLRTISGVLRPNVGTVLLDDWNIHNLKRFEVAQRMAVVPQITSTPFNFTVAEVVLMGRNPYIKRFEGERSKDFQVVERAMRLTNTLHLAERSIDELSGGERQRVIIARALAQEPSVMLLDEPTLHLDINYQIEIMELLRKLCKEDGLIVLAVLHDFNLAAKYCDSLILLDKGRIVSIGPVETVLTSENLKKVFQVDVVIKKHHITNSLYVIPITTLKPRSERSKGVRVHLICGGGSGASLMKLLVDIGYDVSVGVLNVLDTDHEVAQSLNLPVVSAAPFSAITQDEYEENIKMIEKVDAVLLTATPFGHGNLMNLQAAKEALKKGLTVIVIDDPPIEERDFTCGVAKQLTLELKDLGAIFVRSGEEALEFLKDLSMKLNRTAY